MPALGARRSVTRPKRGLTQRPEIWKWSSFAHYATGVEGPVEIESQRTAHRRERLSVVTNRVKSPLSRTERGKGGGNPRFRTYERQGEPPTNLITYESVGQPPSLETTRSLIQTKRGIEKMLSRVSVGASLVLANLLTLSAGLNSTAVQGQVKNPKQRAEAKNQVRINPEVQSVVDLAA